MTHHDRLSNPLFSGDFKLSIDVEANANLFENA